MKNGGERRLRLAEGICYEQYGDRVYLRSIDARKDYLYNGIVYDILQCYAGGGYVPDAAVTDALKREYEIDDEAAFEGDIREFLDALLGEGILLPQRREAPEAGPSVDEQVTLLCREAHLLRSATLELTYRCNERCVHCYVDDGDRSAEELTLAEYRDILDQLRAMGCVKLLLTGGEVCAKDCFLEVARYAASLGMLVDIFSNGIAIDDALFDAIRALKPNSLSFSLYGGDAATHDAVTGVRGSFDRTLRAAMMTKCAGIDTYIKTVALRENVHSLEALMRLGRRLDIPIAVSFTVLDTHNGCSGEKHRLGSEEAYLDVMRMIDRYQPAPVGDFKRDTGDCVCSAGQCGLCIDPFGEVHPCNALPVSLGNARRERLERIWSTAPALAALKNLRFRDVCDGCGACESVDHCGLCLGRAGWQEGKPTVIPEETCMVARAKYRLATEKQAREVRA